MLHKEENTIITTQLALQPLPNKARTREGGSFELNELEVLEQVWPGIREACQEWLKKR